MFLYIRAHIIYIYKLVINRFERTIMYLLILLESNAKSRLKKYLTKRGFKIVEMKFKNKLFGNIKGSLNEKP